MKIEQVNGFTNFTLESPEAFATFKAGESDRNQWKRHPETAEVFAYVRENGKKEKFSVSYEDFHSMIK